MIPRKILIESLLYDMMTGEELQQMTICGDMLDGEIIQDDVDGFWFAPDIDDVLNAFKIDTDKCFLNVAGELIYKGSMSNEGGE